MIEEQHYSITGKKERAIRKISFHEAVEKIKKSFYIGNKKIENSYEILDTDQKALIFVEFTGDTTGQGDLYCYNKIFISNPIKISNSPNKIIQSNKFRSHMQVHEKDFIIPYQHIIQYALCKGYFNDINERFIDMVVEFPFNIGYSLLCETTAQDTIVYAKRKNREIHSRFTLDGEKKLTNKCVFILNRSNQEPNEYYLITMFSGEYLVKEPQDKNIKDELERQRMLEFWRNHALVFNPKDVDLETATYSCPYDLGA